MRRWGVLLAAAAVFTPACVDLSRPAERPCAKTACPEGFVCSAMKLCVPGGGDAGVEREGGIGDGGEDGGVPDGAAPDVFFPTWQFVQVLDPVSTGTVGTAEVPGATLTFTPERTSDVWAVFASGKVESTEASESGAEVVMYLNDVEIDRFGHAFSAPAAPAGFLTFHRVSGSREPQTVRFELVAGAGATVVDDVRVVAARVPDTDAFEFSGNPLLRQDVRYDEPLDTLDATVRSAGDYFVFGKMSQSPAPGLGSVEGWLSIAGTERPLFSAAEGGGRFANARRVFQPMFSALRTRLPVGLRPARLRAISSADAALSPPWWDHRWARRQALEISAADYAVPAASSVRFRFSHDDLVFAGKSLPDGEDVRVVFWDGMEWIELDRRLDEVSRWNASTTGIWFSVRQDIPAGQIDGRYYLYYGNSTPPPAPADGTRVFRFYDDFERPVLDVSKWSLTGTAAISAGGLQLGVSSRLAAIAAPTAAGTVYEGALAAVDSDAAPSVFGISDAAVLDDEYAVIYGEAGTFNFRSCNGASCVMGQISNIASSSSRVFKIFRFLGNGSGPAPFDGVQFIRDTTILRTEGTPDFVADRATPMGFYFSNGAVSLGPVYEWVRARTAFDNDAASLPAVSMIGSEEQSRGTVASSWRHRKLMMFPAASWPGALYAESPEPAVTGSSNYVERTRLEVGAGTWLIVQSARIGAPAIAGGAPVFEVYRRAGVLRQGSAMLETAHAIDADGSAAFGYHHVAGNVAVVEGPEVIANGFRSPDGRGAVEIADSVIIALPLAPE